MPKRPTPSHRNACPSGPWPWLDIDEEIDDDELSPVTPFPLRRPTLKWEGYPKNLYPNWSDQAVERSGIKRTISSEDDGVCTIFNVDVLDTGKFKRPGELFIRDENKGELWDILKTDVSGVQFILAA